MANAILKQFKSQLSVVVAQQLGNLEAIAITYANSKILELTQQLRDTCPPPEILAQLSSTINTLKTLINKVENKTSAFEKIPTKLDKPVAAAKILIEVLSNLPVPSTIGTPPGPAGGVIYSATQGMLNTNAAKLQWIQSLVDALENDQQSIQALVSSTQGIFDPIKVKITQIDTLIQRCAQNPALTKEERFTILNNAQGTIQSNTDPSNTGVSYIGSNGNNYNITIITDTTDGTVAPQRRAIAKDFRGIVVLKGPLSFASSEQVLIDELKFRIDNQLP